MSLNVTDPSDYVGPGILDITLKSDKLFKAVKVKILTTKGFVVHEAEKTPDLPQVTFRAPQDLSLPAGLAIRVTYSHPFQIEQKINVDGDELLRVYKPGEEQKQVWRKSYGKLELVVELEDPLRPTTERILEICPKFRILVMGKSGVGKSSLINKAFGVADALVSDAQPGEAEIDREILSKDNPRFLLHDSRGFEQGEDDTFKIVQDFIKRRSEEPEIKKKLHAIWLCLQIPTVGGRLMETGAEDFLKLKAAGKLGGVPIIVVLTKYDRLVSMESLAMKKAGKESTSEKDKEKAIATFKRECSLPFEAAVGKDIPHIPVSVRPQYPNTISDLIKITFENVEKYIAEAAVVTGISQKINAQVKIRASIEVGKHKHWKGLAYKTMLPEISLRGFLGIIHHDIVKVWNMEDPENFLSSTEFKNLMLNSVEEVPAKRNPNRILMIPKPVVEAITTAVSILSGPAAPIVIPILGAFVLGLHWVHKRYVKTHANLRQIMIYIINLTIVMQNLFWIQSVLATKPRQGSRVSDRAAVRIKRRLIKLAFNLYITASDRTQLIDQVNDYTKKVDFMFRGGRDATIDKIIHLIDSSTISNKDAFAQRSGIEVDRSWEDEDDEEWDPPEQRELQ